MPWRTRSIKSLVQEKNHPYKTAMRNSHLYDMVGGIQDLINRTSKTIEDVKHEYFMIIGETLSSSDIDNRR